MVIGTQLKHYRDKVLDVYEQYTVAKGSGYNGRNNKKLEKLIQQVIDRKFTLVVAGEVKAGKSTFINALLGAEVLPADVLQATSAIIEISKADLPHVKVTYANGDVKEVFDDPATPFIDESKVFLSEVCSLQDKYRSVPVTLVDSLIIHHNVKSVKDINIEALEIQSGLKLANSIEIIQDYITEHSLDKIPVKIQYQYPFKWEFNQLQIVDSPGVNARGGVQDLTFEYMDNANAILFIHPIKPVESESLRKFIDTAIQDQCKDSIFLVLTHAGLYSDDDVDRLYNEAVRLYSDIIAKEKILVVDSMLKLIHIDLANGTPIEEIEKTSAAKEDLLSKFIRKSEKNNIALSTLILDVSRFDHMLSAIDEFSTKAPLLQLYAVVDKIRIGYGNAAGELNDKITRLEHKKKSPQEFEREIARVEKLLGEYELLIKKVAEHARIKFSGMKTDSINQWKDLRLSFHDIINSSKSEEEIRKHFYDFNNRIDDILERFKENIAAYLREECEKIGTKFTAVHHMHIPEIDFDALSDTSKEESYFQKEVKERRTRTNYVQGRAWYNLWKFWEADEVEEYYVVVGHNTVFDAVKFVDSLRFKITKAFDNRSNAIPDDQTKLLSTYLNSFEDEISMIIKSLKDTLQIEKEKKKTNQEIVEEIGLTETELGDIKTELIRVNELLVNLK